MTDWDKELAKIDKQLGSLKDEDLVAPAPAKPAPASLTKALPSSAPTTGGGLPVGSRAATFGLYARMGLSVALAVAMLFWPYNARCGSGLALYLGAVVAVVASGVWSAVWTWRHRAGRMHVLSMLLLLWGLVLGAMETLPRVGYANPTLDRPASWTCTP